MTAQRRTALLAVLAMLLQALLLGWHHHSLRAMPGGGAHAAVSVHNAALPLSPAPDEDRCEICIGLHHSNASPLDFAVPPLPSIGTATRQLPDQAFADRSSDRAFRARAPPPWA